MKHSFARPILYCALTLAALDLHSHAFAAANPPDIAARAQSFRAGLGNDATFKRFIVFLENPAAGSESAVLETSLSDVFASTGTRMKVVRKLATGGWLIEAHRTLEVPDAQRVTDEFARQNTLVHFVHPDYIYHTQTVGPDPNLGSQWHLTGVVPPNYDCYKTCVQAGANVINGWSYSKGQGIVIGVVDTGYTNHPDITPNLVAGNATTLLPGYDFDSTNDSTDSRIGDPTGRDANAHDPGDSTNGNPPSSWHGTHVMGLAAAAYNNSLYGAGVAPSAKILPVRAMGPGGGSDSDISDAIIWASGGSVAGVPYNSTPARVINLSVGGSVPCTASSNFQVAINQARANGTVVVVAAGNANADVSTYTPAGCTGVITVAATNYNGAVAKNSSELPYSNYGAGVSLAAPGGGFLRLIDTGSTNIPIWSDLNTGTTGPAGASFAGLDGTSMATPLVAGLAADVLALKPWLSPDQVKSYIVGHTHPWGTGGIPTPPVAFGSGLMDAAATLAAVSAIPAPAAASMTATPNPVIVPANASSASYTVTWSAPGYATLDSYASLNGGPITYTGMVVTSGTATESLGVNQTITWYLYPHGHTPDSARVASVTITAHH